MLKIFLILFLTTKLSFANNNLFIDYFNNLKNMSSNFIQYEKNDVSEGVFYIQKPDKIRFEYTQPFRTLLISNGKILTYYDMELDEISNIPAKNTPLNLLLNIDINKLKNLSIIKKDDKNVVNTEINISDDNYNITYIFDKDFKNLISLSFKKNDDNEIKLEFFNTKINTNLDKNLFIFRNPRLYKKK